MKCLIIESKKSRMPIAAKAKAAANPIYSAYRHNAASAAALFWSVFGPAARSNFRQAAQYAALPARA
jgi:hypothetical protein